MVSSDEHVDVEKSTYHPSSKSAAASPDSIHDGIHDGFTPGTGNDVDHGADSELQRRLSSRHITMIALGSSIGMGLWLGSGTSLTQGGPAALFIGCK